MKKLLLTIAAIICITSSVRSQILNGSFENWTSGLPDNWWGAILPTFNLLSQTTTAHSGTYAVKLHIDSIGGQPIGTPISTGNGVTTTHPLSFVPLSVSFWYQLSAAGGDELTITALVYSGGSGAGIAILAVPAAANYTQVTVPVQYGVIPATADSIALVFLITHTSGTSHIGSDANIDDVSVSATTGIYNQPAGNSFQITPNPASQFISVELPPGAGKTSEIYIYDVTGRLVYSRTVANAEKKLNIETAALKQGTYYCMIKTGGLENRKPIVIIHE